MASNWQETYRKLKKRKELVDTLSGGGDLAPVKTTKSVVNNRNLYTNGAERQLQKKTTPVKTSSKKKTTSKKTTAKKTSNKKTWFNKGAFDDGYDFGDISRTILGTGTDIAQNVTKGALNIVEGAVDLGTYGVSGVLDLFGADKTAKKVQKFGQKNLVEDWDLTNKALISSSPLLNVIDQTSQMFDRDGKTTISERMDKMSKNNSISGDKTDDVAQGVGYVLGMAGLSYVGVPATATSFVTSAGNGMTEAFNEGATYGEALTSGLISGTVESLSEKLFGGLGKINGKGALDDQIAKTVSKIFKKQWAKTLAEYGIKAVGEGAEEIISNIGSEIGKSLTYDDSEENLFNKEFLSKFRDGYQAGDVSKATGDLIFNEENLEQFINGVIVSGISQSPGFINSIKTGRSYTEGTTQNEQLVIDEEVNRRIEEIEKDGITLTKKQKAKIESEVKDDLKKGYIDTGIIERALGTDADLSKDAYLQRSYQEKSLKQQQFTYEISEQDSEIKRALYESASQVMNDSSRSHEFVETVLKLAEKTGTKYRFVNNETLKQEGYNIDGKYVNGLVNADGEILINIDSQKALNSIVGHETTHLFEGNEVEFNELKEFARLYSESKGDYQNRLTNAQGVYEGINANIENEVTADIIGDYLFTDQEFINRLSVEKPNFFQKIYNEIKHWVNMATAGSKEARQLEQLKHSFEKALNSKQKSIVAANNTDVKFDIENIENFDKEKYNNVKTLELPAKEYGRLAHIIDSSTDIKPGLNTVTLSDKTYDVYYKGYNEYKVVDAYPTVNYDGEVGSNEINEFTNSISEGNETTGSGQRYDQWNNGEIANRTETTNDDGLLDLNKRNQSTEGSSNRKSNGNKGYGNSGELDNSSFFNEESTRYSLSEEGEMVDNQGNEVTLETSETGTHGTLMAIHNLDESKLKGVLELGGFPFPSIAITKPANISHESYGNISVLFDKNTIDPQTNKKNKVYSRDAYTPRFPSVEYEANAKVISKIKKVIGNYDYRNPNTYLSDATNLIDNVEDNINRRGLEETLDKIKKDSSMKYVYLKSTAPSFKEITKTEQYSPTYTNETLQKFIDNYDGKYPLNDIPSSEIDNYVPQMVEVYEEQLRQEYAKVPELDTDTIDEIVELKTKELREKFYLKDQFLTATSKLQRLGTNNQVIDTKATNELIDNTVNQEEYNKWVDELFDGIIAKKGLRNNKDYFTPSGNRRTFDQLHDEYNLDNVVKIMTALDDTGSEGGMMTGINEIAGNVSKRLSSIEDIKNNEYMLQNYTDEEYSQIIEGYGEKLFNLQQGILDRGHDNSSNEFIAMDNLGSAISEVARDYGNGKKVDANKITSKLNEYGFNPTMEESQTILNMFKELPTEYFEAKPKRAVKLNEAQAIVIPNTTSTELKQQLQETGLTYYEYDPSVEGDRQRVINQFDELKFSLSSQNEDIAPTGNYNVYGEDVKLQQAIAPLQEEIKELTETISDLKEQIAPVEEVSDNLSTTEIESTQPTKAELDNLMALQEKGGTEYANTFFELRDKYGQAKLYKGINEYKKSPDSYGIDLSNNFDEDIAPATQETADKQALENFNMLVDEDAPLDEGVFVFDEGTNLEGKGKKNIINEIRNNFNIKQTEARELYNKIAAVEYPTVDDVYKELQEYREFKYQEEDTYYKGIQDYIKGTRLDISKIKDQITDYSNTYRMSNMGKGLILGNSGMSVDSFYEELSELYPNIFPQEITAEIDRLNAISDFLYEDTTQTITETISDEDLYELAQGIHADIGNNERYRGSLSLKYFQNKAIKDGELIAPVETQEEYLKTLPDTLEDGYAPYLEVAKELNSINSPGYSEIRNELDRFNINTQETNNQAEEGIKIGKNQGVKVTKNKSATKNMLNYLFVNRNEAIDRYAKETGNDNIKFLADHVNNVYGEVSTNINNAQIDNYGRVIGKSITDIFNQAREEGLSEAFNDYLFHKSNIARHKQGKGSLVPSTESAILVLEYEKDYPQMKNWAFDVNQYNKRNLYKQVDAGLYTDEFVDKLTKMYDFYVPFFEDIERIYVDNYSRGIGAKGTVKRAFGGSDRNLLDFETAMMKQTQSTITNIRKNQLYREIIESSDEKAYLGNGDVQPLYKDASGYYVSAYVDGQQMSAKISEDLYKGLENKLEQQIKDIEQRLSKITKPLQTIGNIRRNILTSWSPTFMITNPLKDIQDAPLNSKYATSWAKNYPKALKEITTGKGEHIGEFLNMYGQASLMGNYVTDSGVYDVTKSVKTNKKLSKYLQLNEMMELVPRYAEYLASLENGASQMEALYNAREVTTNFGRGGVITKAVNRNGFTFLNASVQGFNKLYRNFSGENGAKGVANATLKAVSLGVLPALFNELVFGSGEDKDEEYEALPDYIKDNYYLIKTDDGEFIRIPKGRMLSIFGSAARRTLEMMQGEEDAFDGYLKNAYSQVGIQNPMESNILAPFLQAYGSENGETWYGTDIVPSRLQDVPDKEQYDETIDKFSIWLGDKTGISPYKFNYVLDQYSGGFGDIILPMMTEEATSDAETIPEMILAPIKDKFTANSTTDNKYVSDVYTLSDELYKKSNSVNATDDDKLINQYIYSITSDMGELYAERRAVQNNDSLTKAEKYRRSQAIKDEINRLAKEGLDNYQNVNKTDNYAIVGGREFNKYTTEDGEERWGSVFPDILEEMNALGMELEEKSTYFQARDTISNIKSNYSDSNDYMSQKRDIIGVIKGTNLTDDQKAYLYDKYYASTDTLNAVTTLGINFDSYLDYESQEFVADKDKNGKSISGSKKEKVFNYINSMDIEFEQKLILAKLQYNSYDEYNRVIVEYLNNSDLSYEEEVALLKKMGFEVKSNGKVTW